MIGYFIWIMGFIALALLLLGGFTSIEIGIDDGEWLPATVGVALVLAFAALGAYMLAVATEDEPRAPGGCTIIIRDGEVTSSDC